MLDDFVIRSLVVGLGVAAVAGPMGCFVVWQRMSYFGAAISHSALLGVALGFAFEFDPLVGILVVCLLFAIGMTILERSIQLASDTLLGIFAHVALSLGIIAVSFLETVRLDLMGYLFGDILAVTWLDIVWIYAGGAVALAILATIWRSMLAITVHEELAAAEGVAVGRNRLFFTLLLATVIAMAMKIVGILLIISLLIIPAATARAISRTPEHMALWAAVVGALAVAGGLGASLRWDTASGPSIVAVAFVLFLASRCLSGRQTPVR